MLNHEYSYHQVPEADSARNRRQASEHSHTKEMVRIAEGDNHVEHHQ
jgi:hypothetical protein